MTEVIISARIPLDSLQSSVKRAFRETAIHESFKLKPDWVDGSIYVRKESGYSCSTETACLQLQMPFWARKPMSVPRLIQTIVYTILNRNDGNQTAEAGK